ncbi:uncharacterized protein LOC128234441 [Mya arenaria]|uniref:uncharacterized protein LOC128234441 n=1 Tax=Mya arenaria TaxID=6604 RepID=UPI0022E3954D|nr:uncharacterized protein LOC128234441 [Mya arenaria]
MASITNCVPCSKIVTARMHVICCEVCERWQHCKCDSGVSAQQYQQMVKNELNLAWKFQFYGIDRYNSEIRAADEVADDDADEVAEEGADDEANTVAAADEVAGDTISTNAADGILEDRTFDILNRSFDRPHHPLDESLPERPLDKKVPTDLPATFEVIEGGSKRGGRKLVSSAGYTYTARRNKGSRTYWTCSIRSKKMTCPASVKQFGDMFTPSIVGHVHLANPVAAKKIKISTKVKEAARERVFESAANIVERVMKQMTTPHFSLSKPGNLARAANHHRRQRPDDPADLGFQLERECFNSWTTFRRLGPL